VGAALGIYFGLGCGWLLGVVAASISVVLYVVQEIVGLPGLPKMWLEPSRLLALLVEGLFVVLAERQLATVGRSIPGGEYAFAYIQAGSSALVFLRIQLSTADATPAAYDLVLSADRHLRTAAQSVWPGRRDFNDSP
jgi:hypothetical protein